MESKRIFPIAYSFKKLRCDAKCVHAEASTEIKMLVATPDYVAG